MRTLVNLSDTVDSLRGMYVRSPPWLRRALAAPLSTLPVSVRYGRQYYNWRAKIRGLRGDAERRANYVNGEREALIRVASTAPYYRTTFADVWPAGLPSGTRIVTDWHRIPVLTKDTVREAGERLIVPGADRMGQVSTSGSSGKPLAFLQDERRSVAEFAYHTDLWSRAGYRPGDLRCVFRGMYIHDGLRKHMELEPALGELRCSTFDLTDEPLTRILGAIRQRRIKYILGYSGTISIFAAFLLRTGNAPLAQIRGVFPASEKFYPRHREVLRQAFPKAEIIPSYGLSEKVAFAAEVEGKPDVYSFDPTYAYVELLDEGGMPVTEPGRRGRIVGSGFISKGMPLVRYDTGDEATLIEAPTRANGYRLLAADITSKHQSYLVAKSGAVVSPASLTPNSDTYRHVSEFQFFQEQPGVAELRIAAADGASSEDVETFADEMRSYLGTTIDLKTVLVESIPPSARGKRKMIDQRIPTSALQSAWGSWVDA
jgi:phenylacetate-CoA ligase